jgi:hypothetical protein
MRRPPDQNRSPEAVIETLRDSPIRRSPRGCGQAAVRVRWVNCGIALAAAIRNPIFLLLKVRLQARVALHAVVRWIAHLNCTA